MRSLLAPENRRTVVGVVLAVVVTAFGVSNLDEVEVNWIFWTAQTPLIVVIAVSFALGLGAGILYTRRRGQRSRAA